MALIASDALDETLHQEMYDIKMYAWVLKNKLDGGRYPGFMDDLRELVKLLTEAIDERDNIQPTKCS